MFFFQDKSDPRYDGRWEPPPACAHPREPEGLPTRVKDHQAPPGQTGHALRPRADQASSKGHGQNQKTGPSGNLVIKTQMYIWIT